MAKKHILIKNEKGNKTEKHNKATGKLIQKLMPDNGGILTHNSFNFYCVHQVSSPLLPTLIQLHWISMGYEIVQQEKLFTVLIYALKYTLSFRITPLYLRMGWPDILGIRLVSSMLCNGDEDARFFLIQDEFNKHLHLLDAVNTRKWYCCTFHSNLKKNFQCIKTTNVSTSFLRYFQQIFRSHTCITPSKQS